MTKKIEEIEKQIEQLKSKKQKMISLENEKKRKERTKRLIEIGSIFETYFQIESKKQAIQIAKGFTETVIENKEYIEQIEITEEERRKHKL